ncbi:NAD(P)/FAD-dependent oxidoreductase [Roseobacteraceae bacterium S113]
MDLLTANDRPGHYPDSWYAATAAQLAPFPKLQGSTKADVCIVGAGFTGLSCALSLAKAGRRVVVLEASRVGFGASGRNGGQLGSGQRQDQKSLERMIGPEAARRMWELGEDAKAHVTDLIETHEIDCHLKMGLAWVGEDASDAKDLQDYAGFLRDRYGYAGAEALDGAALHEICPSPAYRGGMIDWQAGHLHPLRFAQGLAQAAAEAGAQIHENTRVIGIEDGKVQTDAGIVDAGHIVLACNGYLGGLAPKVAARVMPINNFIAATEPLGERTQDVLRRDVAVADSRFVVNYFRLSHDGRLLFGGGETYGYRFPNDIAAKVRKPMLEIFPSLADARIDYAWGGTLAITMKRLPYVARIGPRMLSASGYSGHGVGTATHAGHLMARAIEGETDGFDALAALPCTPFPGGPAMRSPLLVLAMSWYALRDRLGF